MRTKISINNKLILVFLSIFLITNSTVMFGTNSDYIFVQMSYIYLIISSLFIIVKTKRANGKKMTAGILMTAIIVFTSLINRDFPMSNIKVILLIINALLLSDYIRLPEFAFYFDKILYFITILSLILSSLVLVNKNVFSIFPTITNTSHSAFKNLILYVVESENNGVYRNHSLFREPGVFQTYLSLGLLFQIFVLEKKSTKKIIVYFIGLATTLSTTGYIAAGIYVVYLLSNSKVLKRKYKVLALVAVLGILAYLFFLTDFLNNSTSGYSIFGKIVEFKLVGNYLEIGGAAVARIASVVMDIYIAAHHLLFGFGTNNVMESYPNISRMLYGTTLTYTTETLFQQAARYGIFYFLFWIIGYYRLARKVSNKKIYAFIVAFVSLLIMIIAESYVYNVLVYLLMFYGLFETLNKTNIHYCN